MWYLEYDDQTYAAVYSWTVRRELDVPVSHEQRDLAFDAAKRKLVEEKSKREDKYKERGFKDPRLIWREMLPSK